MNYTKVSVFLQLECAKSLLTFYELEEDIFKEDEEEMKKIKHESNDEIKVRNKDREIIGYKALNSVCKNLGSDINFPTPCKIDAVIMLMTSGEYTSECNIYFKEIINDLKLDCDYRYKTILSLEKKKEIKNINFYIKEACISFLNNTGNKTMYRILSGQNLLQNYIKDDEKQDKIVNLVYETLYSFSSDKDLDYNLRADSADTLLSLGNDYYKKKAEEIIILLGTVEGQVRTLYNNAQNVHTKEIEKSVGEILEFLLTYPTILVNENPIDFAYVTNVINKMIKSELPNQEEIKDEKILENETQCDNCKLKLTEETKFCNTFCEEMYMRHLKIRISLNRIEMDRVLYSKYSSNLSNILIKLWSYIQENEFKDAMEKRLIEELEDMSGTCSSGFLGRLVNTLSGFGQLSIRISFDDQLISNFVGRLNMYARRLTDADSHFRNDKLYQVIELYMYNHNLVEEKKKDITIKDVINAYLSVDRETKINDILEDFEDKVLGEMTQETNKFKERRHFLLFFRAYMLRIREELYEEFKDFMTDTEFDLCIRKAITLYEGVDYLI